MVGGGICCGEHDGGKEEERTWYSADGSAGQGRLRSVGTYRCGLLLLTVLYYGTPVLYQEAVDSTGEVRKYRLSRMSLHCTGVHSEHG